jgi:diacylglycerol kinase family enzyme
MIQESALKYLFVINPISGGKQKDDHETAIKKHFDTLSHSVEFFLLDGKNDAQQLTETLEKVKPHKVVAVGGDGTVSLVAKKLLGSEMQLGILPAGSANGMARELNIPISITEALEVVTAATLGRQTLLWLINRFVCT